MNLTFLKRCVSGFILIGITTLPVNIDTPAQGWRGIVPIRSTCREIERDLGGDACAKKLATYELPGENISFVFSHDGCNGKWPQQRYNVPTGTVVGISLMPKASKHLTIADLKVDLSKFRKTEIDDVVDGFKYVSPELGMYFTASGGGQVLDITYVPPSSYDNLRCQPSTKPTQ
jgi:hypothetical protein